MYSQMKTLACRFKSSFQSIFKRVWEILQAIRKETKDKIDKISDEIIRLQKEATAEAKREAKRLQKQKGYLTFATLDVLTQNATQRNTFSHSINS